MARISLRAYNRDIEAMIDKNQIDEAFAHCRYILELYPKHVDTYRLMGKALLEAQRFSDAADVFYRVLSSVPDDFISHLGMSIIREDESNLDAAIWHMERSFEVQPSNAAVQVELRRLYGLRDGVTPQKIQLTRGGLARMSAKSNLHSQAIAELRAALSNDPQRPDLQVVLAKMYHETGARMEAIETCNSLINKLPYCLTANRILAEVLPETERADQAHEYKTRVGELDPYYLQLSPVAPTLEQVPDGAVTIERYEYEGETYATIEQDQPGWAASLGVDLDEETGTGEPTPDWLEEDETAPGMEQEVEPDSVDEEIHLGSGGEEETPEEDDLLDWMGEIGEAESGAEEDLEIIDKSAPAAEDESDIFPQVEEIQEDEQLPDWMRESDEAEAEVPGSLAGAAAVAGAAVIGSALTGEDDQDAQEQADTGPQPEVEGAPELDARAEPDMDIVDDSEQDEEDETGIFAGEAGEIQDEEQLPDWMREADEEEEETASIAGAAAVAGAAALGAKLVSDEDEKSAAEAVADTGPEQEPPSAAEDEETIPDWMTEAGAADTTASEEVDATAAAFREDEPVEGDVEFPASGEAEQIPDWVDEAEAGSEIETPDWLRDAMEGTEEPLQKAGAAAAGAALVSDMESDESQAEPIDESDATSALAQEADAENGEELESETEEELEEPAAQEDIGPGAAAAVGTAAALGSALTDDDETGEGESEVDTGEIPAPVTQDETIDEDIPDWLQDLGEDLPAGEAEPEPAVLYDEPGAEDAPIPLSESDTELDEPQPESVERLDGAAGEEAAPVIESDLSEEQEFPESIPDWLSEVSPEEIPPEVSEAETEVDIVRAEIPVWLRKMEAQHKAEMESVDRIEDLEFDAEFTELSGDDVPSWLMSAMEPELAPPADETLEVDDIGEVFEGEQPVEIDEIGLESTTEEFIEEELEEQLEEPAEEVEFDDLQEELAPQDAVPEEDIETADEELVEVTAISAEVQEEIELESGEDVLAEEIEEREDEEPEGIGLAGAAAAAAAGVAAAHLFDEDDTQPIAVTAEPEPAEELEAAEEIPEPDLELDAGIAEDEAAPDEEVLPSLDEIEEQSVLAGEAALSGEDEDAAMAWLESLAAKQGAAEEELLTSADERQEGPPEWVLEEAAEGDLIEEEQADERDTALTDAALAGVTAGLLAERDEAEAQGEGELAPEIEAEPELAAEEEPGQPPEWVPEILAEEQQPQVEEASEDDLIEPEAGEFAEEAGVVEELAEAADIDLEEIEEIEPPEEIPDWLSGIAEDQEDAEADTVEWTPAMLEEREVELPLDAPVEKIDLNAASLAQLEKIPGIGFILAQNIVTYRAEKGSFTNLEQLGEVEGLDPEIVTDLQEYLAVEVVSEAAAPEPEIPELQDAWSEISAGNIEGAVDQYSDLINQEQHLDEIIRDLQAAISRYPSDSSLYQSLGDAYMHANMLQEALDAYNRAEDLI